MKELLETALNEAKKCGADYADVRVVKRTSEPLSVKNGQVTNLSSVEDEGFGVRVWIDGGWGFASSGRLSRAELRDKARQASQIAKASARVQQKPKQLSAVEAVEDTYTTEVKVDPFEVSGKEKLDLLREIDEIMRRPEQVRVSTVSTSARREEKIFMSTEGSYIEQVLTETGLSMSATAAGEGDVQRRSFRDQVKAGFEFVQNEDLHEKAENLSDEAVQLLTADVCPQTETDLILGSSQLALQIHESCGHPIELDRVYGSEASFAGTSFLTTDKLGDFQYGSPLVNIVADATVPGGLGTFGYDDEGVPAQRAQIVEEGRFVDYLTSRQTAATLQQESNGCMLADGWSNVPLVRMTNINLEPGEGTLQDIIEDTEHGILMDAPKSWSLDDKRLNFHFGCEYAYEIVNGEITRLLKNPAYTATTPQFWNSCDAIAGQKEWRIWGLPSCAKGEPVQIAHVGHGASPARFRNIEVGVQE